MLLTILFTFIAIYQSNPVVADVNCVSISKAENKEVRVAYYESFSTQSIGPLYTLTLSSSNSKVTGTGQGSTSKYSSTIRTLNSGGGGGGVIGVIGGGSATIDTSQDNDIGVGTVGTTSTGEATKSSSSSTGNSDDDSTSLNNETIDLTYSQAGSTIQVLTWTFLINLLLNFI
ncbi:MAG: hypothetical protein M5E90_02985 [Asgard group archaeon]|nr:hypothetical protein [Asgard group archaeon]